MTKSENLKREFKRIRIVHIVVLCAVVFVAFSILGTTLLAAGGPWKSNFSLRDGLFTVAHGDPVNVDEQVEQELAGLAGVRITTVSTNVILTSGGDKVKADLKGVCRNLDAPVRLESELHGDVLILEVKHPKQKRWGNWSGSDCSTSLTVMMPDDYQGDFKIVTVSGDMYARNLPLILKEVTLETVSGDVDFGIAGCRELSAKSVSGDLTLRNVASPTSVNTISGDVEIYYEKAAETRVETVSGDVDIAVPTGESFAVDFQSTSGEFESRYPGLFANDVRRNFHGTVGNGDEHLRINTVSGDCELKTARQSAVGSHKQF